MAVEGHTNGAGDARAELLSFVATGNAMPVLHEIRHALARLIETGEGSTIDLGAIPFAPGDERVLDEVLGTGEVSAVITAMGKSLIAETAIAGVWRVDHYDTKGETESRFIEVTVLPDILKTQIEDAREGLALLTEKLGERPGSPSDPHSDTDTKEDRA